MTRVHPSVLPDLLRALTVLQPADEAERVSIARLFGIEAAAPVPLEPPKPPALPQPPKPTEPGQAKTAQPPSSLVSESAPSNNAEEIPSVLVPDSTESRGAPDWLESVDLLPEADGSVAAPAPEPLLVPLWVRGVLSASAATSSEAGPLDVERLVRGISRGRVWLRIPRQVLPTLARGALVLVDKSDALLPFAADQEELAGQIRAIVGRESVQVLDFEGCPTWGVGTGSREEWHEDFERWRPPAGTPVLALTDLGIGAGHGIRTVHPAAWRAVAERLRQAGCSLVAFVPYARERWPAGLDRALHIVLWDRGTNARTARRTLVKARRLGEDCL